MSTTHPATTAKTTTITIPAHEIRTGDRHQGETVTRTIRHDDGAVVELRLAGDQVRPTFWADDEVQVHRGL